MSACYVHRSVILYDILSYISRNKIKHILSSRKKIFWYYIRKTSNLGVSPQKLKKIV